MEFLVLISSLFVIVSGFAMLMFLIVNSVINRNVHTVFYSPRSENETEYGLRTLLFLYPNAVINTTGNTVSKKLELENNRIITHQEL